MDEKHADALGKLCRKIDAIVQDGETDPDVRKGNRMLTKAYCLHACIVEKVEELLEFIEKNNVSDLKVIKAWLRERTKYAADGKGVIGPRDPDE